MRRAALILVVLVAAAAGAKVAFAATLGVSAKSLTTYAAASTVPTSSCNVNPSQDAYVETLFGSSNHGGTSTLPVGSTTVFWFFRRVDKALVQFDTSCVPANAKIVAADLRLYLGTGPSGARDHGAHRITSSWTSGGSVPSISGTATDTTTASSTGWMQWDVAGDVQSFVTGTANYGWAIQDDDSGDASAAYDASEGSSEPELRVTYWP